MNKRDVALLLMAYTGRVLWDFHDFHRWAEKRLGRPIMTHELSLSFGTAFKELRDSITEEEWRQIARWFTGKEVEGERGTKRPKVIAVDLDGVVLDYDGWRGHDNFGKVKEGAKEALAEFKKRGWVVVIWTTRGRVDKVEKYLREQGVPFDYINENPYGPPDSSRKIHADVYIDDKAVRFRDWEQARSEVIRILEG